MPAEITLELTKTDLLFQESTACRLELRNTGRTPLRSVNPENRQAFPLLVVKNLRTEEVLRFSRKRVRSSVEPPYDVAAGENSQQTFDLTEVVSFPSPGKYELTAVYVWADGTASSLPVSINLRPAEPAPGLHLVSALGGLAPLQRAVWLNRPKPDEPGGELWLSTFRTTSRPDFPDDLPVTRHAALTSVKTRVRPYLSVPPNKEPDVQWVVWMEGKKLRYLLHESGGESEQAPGPEPLDLGVDDCRIVSPPLANLGTKGHKPGVSILLYRPRPEGPGGDWILAELTRDQRPEATRAAPCPSFAWAETAYLSDLRRRTFLLVPAANETRLDLMLSSWAQGKPPEEPKVLHSWGNLRLHAAGLTVVRESNVMRGIVFGELPGTTPPEYALYPWVFSPKDELTVGEALPVRLPEGARIDSAVARINQNGAPCALVRWGAVGLFCNYDGSVKMLEGDILPPIEILYELAEMPILLYTKPQYGFQFIRP